MSTPAATPPADASRAAPEEIEAASGEHEPGPAPVVEGGAPFSLALSQDQKDIRDWVHGFAADVVRPAAHEWDEKEQTPWPVIQEAAKIGLYGYEGLGEFFADPTGLTLTMVNEELFWGAAGVGLWVIGTP